MEQLYQLANDNPPVTAAIALIVYHEIRILSIEMVLGIGRFKGLKDRFKKGAN